MAATFEKAKTYVFAATATRDREVGGSNPLSARHFQALTDRSNFAKCGISDMAGSEISERSGPQKRSHGTVVLRLFTTELTDLIAASV